MDRVPFVNVRLAPAEAHLVAACPGMAKVAPLHEPFPSMPTRPDDPYPSLVRAVVFQQLSGKAAQTILNRVLALFSGMEFPTPQALLDVAPDALRSAGLSRQKIAAVQDVARKTLDGVIPPPEVLETLPDDEVIARLTSARGVGRWTAEMHLIFAMGRPDVFPLDDVGVRRGAERLFDRSFTRRELGEFGARWAPWRSAAAWHLWRVADTVTPPPP